MNKTIYLATIRKILKFKFVCFMLVVMGLLMPMTLILSSERPSVTSVESWDAFAVSTVIGLIIVTATNAIGNTLTLGGRSDYMPLIVTRPLHRFQYVTAKWLALATIISVVSLTQHVLLSASGTYEKWGLTAEMIACNTGDRILSALCIASILTLIYLLPSQSLVLCGIIGFEISAGISFFSMSIAVPMPETAGSISDMVATIFGIDTFCKNCLFPAIFGGTATTSIQQYVTVVMNLSSFFAPQINLYDIIMSRPFKWTPLLEIASNILVSLTLASMVLNAREYHYDSD